MGKHACSVTLYLVTSFTAHSGLHLCGRYRGLGTEETEVQKSQLELSADARFEGSGRPVA